MAIGLVGQKLGMTRVLSEDGSATPVSVIKIEPNRIIQTKTMDIDGYRAIQVSTGAKVNKKGEAKVSCVPNAIKGHYAKATEKIGLGLWEFRVDAGETTDVKQFDVSFFGAGHYVDVVGQSKGKGFQGGVKRHNFQMQDATHGNSVSHRALGSTGQCQDPGRVFKGKKMAGHMGSEQVTEECLEIIRVDNDRNLILVKGAIPGAKNCFVKVLLSHKKSKSNALISKQLGELQAEETQKPQETQTTKVEEKAEKTVAKTEKVEAKTEKVEAKTEEKAQEVAEKTPSKKQKS